MCEFFSSLVVRDGRILFTESNHHSLAIARARLRDDELWLRPFVRLECPPPHERFRVDEKGALPTWFEERYGDGVALDELGRRVRSVSETVAKLLKDRRDAFDLAHQWEVETRANLNKKEEHPWLYPFDAVESDRKRRDELMAISRRVMQMYAIANSNYELALRSLDGYLPPTPGEIFDADNELAASYNLWGTLPSPISLGPLPQSTSANFISYSAWKKSRVIP